MKIQRNAGRKGRAATLIWGVLAALIVLAVLLAPWLAPNDYMQQDLLHKFAGPSRQYPFGTDDLGRCIFSRLLYGGRATLGYAALSTVISAVIGTMVGMTSGYFGGWADHIIMRLCDILYAFPSLVITLVIVAVLGSGMEHILAALLMTQWLYYARMSRGMTLEVKTHEFVSIARLTGSSRIEIILRYILPNIIPQMIAVTTIDFGHTILTISGLSFLGMGVQPPKPEWGMMISNGRNFINRNPMIMLWPGLMILLTVLSVNVIGDHLRDAIDEAQK